MLKYFDLKLYRKFLILAVLLVGLFAVSSANKTSAYLAICCSACDNNYDNCVTACYNGDPRALNKCLDDCSDDFDHCYSGPPPCNINC